MSEMTLEQFKQQFVDAECDEKRLVILSGLIEEAYDCKNELTELKAKIKELKDKGARFTIIARREKLLVQKRQNYTNMIGRICKETKKAVTEAVDFGEGLEDYE